MFYTSLLIGTHEKRGLIVNCWDNAIDDDDDDQLLVI